LEEIFHGETNFRKEVDIILINFTKLRLKTTLLEGGKMINKNSLKKSLFACILSLVMVVGFSYPQAMTGKIVGTVVDDQGIPLPGVAVEISSQKLMGTRSAITGGEGEYRFINLPPGLYLVTFEMDGFNRVERQNIRVSIGGTVTVDATMAPRAIEEEVLVISEAPVIDVQKTGVSSIMTDEDLQKLPTGRSSIASQLDFAPGFTGGSSFGSDDTDNNYALNGLQIASPESGEFRMTPDIEMVDEMEVSASGASAEYGQSTGGVVNVVTKYGGNDFEGMVGLYLQPDFLVGDNNPQDKYDAEWQSRKHNRWHDASIMLSGAVAKDKIWFFAYLNNAYRSIVRFRGDPEFPRKSRKWAAEFKVTGQIGTEHRVSMNFFWLYTGNPMKEPSEFVAVESTAYHYFSKPSHFGFWDWQMSNNSLFSVKMGYWCNPEREGDPIPEYGSSLYRAPHFDEHTAHLTNATDFFLMWNNARMQVNTTLTYYAEDFVGGDHDFKVGVQLNRGESHPAGGYPGNAYYFDLRGQPYRVYQRNPHHYGGKVQGIGMFVDDTIKVGERLTVNAGLRFDFNKGWIPEWPQMDGPDDQPGTTAPGLDPAVNWKTWSPRLGFTYQLTPDHKTILKGFWGIFRPMPHGTKFGAPGPGIRDTFKYQYIGPPFAASQLPYYTVIPDPPYNTYKTNPQIDPDNWELYDFTSGDAGYTMDPDLKAPYSWHINVGLDREILTDFALGLSFVYKKEKDLIGLIDQGIAGQPGPEYAQVQRTSPDSEAAGYPADKTYSVFDFVGGSHFIVQTNHPEYDLTYKSVILTFNKRYSNNWLLQGSIQWQNGEGLNMAMERSGQGQEFWQNTYGQDPNDWVNRKGPLPFIRKWYIKARFAYTLPAGINVGVNYTFAYGELYGREIRIPDLGQGSRTIWAEPLGEYRHSNESVFDLRVEKVFRFEPIRLHLIADIFNLTNEYLASTARPGQESSYGSTWVGSDSYLQPRRITEPRIIQIGVKLVF
jgi:hypothetical protein